MGFNFLQRRLQQTARQSEWYWHNNRERNRVSLEKNKIPKTDKPITKTIIKENEIPKNEKPYSDSVAPNK